MNDKPIVIVGAGHSGAKAAASLRKHGWQGGIELVGAEPGLPYDRPPLSKAVLLGAKKAADCVFFNSEWYAQREISLLSGQAVNKVLRANHQVQLENGKLIEYSRLILATGAKPRIPDIPGIGLGKVYALRTMRDAQALASALTPGVRLVVIGGGVIGLEAAAAAMERGCTVRVFEAAPQVLGRSVPAEFAKAIMRRHEARGISIKLNAKITRLLGDGAVQGVELASGEVFPCDVLVYGIGVTPSVALAEQSGLLVKNGIHVDAFLNTEDEAISCCGDVSNFDSLRFGRKVRLENWRNAEDQAVVVARNVLGHAVKYDPLPWFWSNQFDWALQVVGLFDPQGLTGIYHEENSSYFINFSHSAKMVAAGATGPVRNVGAAIRIFKHKMMEGAGLRDLETENLNDATRLMLMRG